MQESPMKPLVSLAFLACLMCLAGPAGADLQDDEVTPTGWWWFTNVGEAELEEQINNGMRMIDIEIDSHSPLRYTAAFVKNSGPYASGWWWYADKSAQQISNLMVQHNARLIDLEPYNIAGSIRYACLMVPNTGSEAAVDHDFEVGLTSAQLDAWFDYYSSSRRIVDIQPYTLNGETRFAFVWVKNSGAFASPYTVWINASRQEVLDKLDETNSRLSDIEKHAGLYSCVMVPRDGNSWWWALDLSLEDAKRFGRQHAARIVDVERTADGTFHLLARRNANNLTVITNNAMRENCPLKTSSGFMLREINGTTLAAVNRSKVFEPASTMKTMHLFASLWTCMIGWDSLTNTVNVPKDISGSCPSWASGSDTLGLQRTLWGMMKSSNNRRTEAILKRYSEEWIESIVHWYGAESVQLNHTIGCNPGSNRNEVTLNDLYAIHSSVANGDLGTFGSDFYAFMLNSDADGLGVFAAVLDDALALSTLAPIEEQDFRLGVFTVHKGGNYQYSEDGSSIAHHSAAGLVRLPFRNGCTTVEREYFIGAWVNDQTGEEAAAQTAYSAYTALFRNRVRAAITSWESSGCALGDVDGNGEVNLDDLILLINNWGPCETEECIGDLNGDGEVGMQDYTLLLSYWFG